MGGNDWFESASKGQEIDASVEHFLKNLKKKPAYDNVFDWLKNRITKRPLIKEESDVRSSLEAKLARDPTNEYIKEAIRNLGNE